MKVVFVGGGKAAALMLEEFHKDKDIDVIGLADPNRDADGVRRARDLGIRTFTDLKDVVSLPGAEVVLEMTGSARVRKLVIEAMRSEQDVISGGGVRMMAGHMARTAESRCLEVAEQLRGLITQMNGAVLAGNSAAKGIEQVMREIRLLALNGNVEAARAGESGRAFAVVVQRMQVLVGEVAKAVDAIGTSSRESHEVLKLMERTEDLLRDNAHSEMMSTAA